MSDLSGRVIAITGAGAGIGLGILRAVFAAGAEAWGLEISEEGRAAIVAEGGHALPCDVADVAGLRDALTEVRRQGGRLDGLVSNAGITRTAPFLDADAEMWEELWQVNQRAVLVGCQTAARIMVADGSGGSIVNIASVHATASDRGYEAYAGTKGAILAMGKAMAWSLGDKGIRVNTLSPGLVMTETVAKVVQDPVVAQLFASWHADGAVTHVDEIGQLAVFLLSDQSAAFSGAELVAVRATLARLCDFG